MWDDDPSEPLTTAVAFGIFLIALGVCGLILTAGIIGNALWG